MKAKFIILSSLLITAISCNLSSISKTEREGEPDIYNIESDNSNMIRAIRNANDSIELFKKALLSNNEDYYDFAIKQKFDHPEGGEHIWIYDIQFIDSEFVGIVGNEPMYTTEVEFEEKITIDQNRISDWMYFDNGVVRGGYTLKALIEEMSPEEKEVFEAENDLIFE